MMKPKTRSRNGYSLIDTLAAGAVMAIVLTPALGSMQNGLALSREAEELQTTTTLCVGKMEEQLAMVAADFTETSTAGDFAADGFSDYRFTATCSADPVDGGIADRLMAIDVMVWRDADDSSTRDSGETHTILKSKVAKMTTYVEGAL